MSQQRSFALTVFGLQAVMVILFGIFFTYEDANVSATTDTSQVPRLYAHYQDVHVMIFVGIGLLYSYLCRHAFSSCSFNFIVAVLSVQWAIIVNAFVHSVLANEYHSTYYIDLQSLLTGDFAAATVLISYGVVLGRTTPTQMVWMMILELIFYAINEYICVVHFEAVDIGGSLVVHAFGAYFGLGVGYMLGVPNESEINDSTYTSDLFAMVGTLFLWVFWPSFNSALAPVETFSQQRVIINTVLSLCGSVMATFVTSILLSPHRKFDMVHIQNSSLAGGVAIGTSSDFFLGPVIAVCVGMLAGFLSTCGYIYLSPMLESRWKLVDVAGAHNLHGIPGVLAGCVSAIAAAAIKTDRYGDSLLTIFPALSHRSKVEQGGYQFACVLITVGIAVSSGLLTGKFLSSEWFYKLQFPFEDIEWFEVPDDYATIGETSIEMKQRSSSTSSRSISHARRHSADIHRRASPASVPDMYTLGKSPQTTFQAL